MLRDLVVLGVDDVTVRVTRYDHKKRAGHPFGLPVQWQAIVKHRDRNRVWGVGIAGDPDTALEKAIAAFSNDLDDGMDLV
jgi:hypothetical protein